MKTIRPGPSPPGRQPGRRRCSRPGRVVPWSTRRLRGLHPAVGAEVTLVAVRLCVVVLIGIDERLELSLAGRALPAEEAVRVEREGHSEFHLVVAAHVRSHLGVALTLFSRTYAGGETTPEHGTPPVRSGLVLDGHRTVKNHIDEEGSDPLRKGTPSRTEAVTCSSVEPVPEWNLAGLEQSGVAAGAR